MFKKKPYKVVLLVIVVLILLIPRHFQQTSKMIVCVTVEQCYTVCDKHLCILYFPYVNCSNCKIMPDAEIKQLGSVFTADEDYAKDIEVKPASSVNMIGESLKQMFSFYFCVIVILIAIVLWIIFCFIIILECKSL